MQSRDTFLGDVDVVVIGGGPSGCSTALHLHQINPAWGDRLILLEKYRHPREKICGGALTYNAERILADLGINLDIPSTPVHHVRLIYGKAHIDLPEKGCAKCVVRRSELDDAIFQVVKNRAIRTMEEVKVEKVVREPRHLLVHTDKGYFRAQVVVSADGINAVLRRTHGFGPGKMSRIYVAETPADSQKEQVFTDQLLLIDMSYVRQGLAGYFWEFPCHIRNKPYLSRGIVASSRVGNAAFLSRILDQRGVDQKDTQRSSWPIRHFNPSEYFAQPRMLLVGDAMGADPLFSEGISQALASGRLAAEAIDHAFSHEDLSFSSYTRNVLNSRLGKELTAYARAARFFYGKYAEFLLSLLYQDPELRSLIGLSYAGSENISERFLRLIGRVSMHMFSAKTHMRNFLNDAELSDVRAEVEAMQTV